LFEFGIALRYLLPRRRSLSTALVSLMSVFVISLVVWLVLVFLSVTTGIEKNWLQKLTALHAPLRISPTEEYYQSYYYKIDSISSASRYTLKTIGEKAESPALDPYIAAQDAEIPDSFPLKEEIDPVKSALQELSNLGLTFQDYEISGALLRIHRSGGLVLSQMSYLLSQTEKNPSFHSLIVDSRPIVSDKIPIILPKNYQKNGVEIGDIGTLGYSSFSALSAQEQRIPVIISAFYDPGLISLGNKCIIVPSEITRMIHASSQTLSPDNTPVNGIFVWIDDLRKIEEVKQRILQQFEKANISKYWKIDTYREFEFSKDFIQQFQSDKTLFLLIASIILLVACCNIISLLTLLVNEKKKEIAILETMGASFQSIALIFGTCGAIIGILSCLIGSMLACFTLYHLDKLVQLLNALQGHNAFNPAFFGHSLPNELSITALLFVFILTPILSLTAGLVPAIKASRIRASTALRAE